MYTDAKGESESVAKKANGIRSILENEIDEIEELHTLRRHTKALVESGIATLAEVAVQDEILRRSIKGLKLKKNPGPQIEVTVRKLHESGVLTDEYVNDWANEQLDEPWGYFNPAMMDLTADKNHAVVRRTREAFKQRLNRLENVDGVVKDGVMDFEAAPASNLFRLQEKLTVKELQRTTASWRRGRPGRLPILEAARCMQALLQDPRTTFSSACMSCYYLIIRELYTIQAPEWNVGSARAAEGSVASAFITGECTRALSALARSLNETASVINLVGEMTSSLAELESNLSKELLPSEWLPYEYKRLFLSLFVDIQERRQLLAIDTSFVNELAEEVSDNSKSCKEALADLQDGFLSALKNACLAGRAGLTKTKKEISGVSGPSSNTSESLIAMADTKAEEAISDALEAADYVLEVLDTDAPDADRLKLVALRLEAQANRVQKLLRPAVSYLESVLDRELTSASLGHNNRWNAAELAFAAAALASMKQRQADPRLHRARTLLEEHISPDGDFILTDALESDFQGYSLIVLRAEILRAFAQLMEHTDIPVKPWLVRSMLSRFEVTKIQRRGSHSMGWTHDNPRYPRKAYRWTTATSVLALDRIERMLARRINERVYKHFSVKRPGSLGIRLSDLFYPDFGSVDDTRKDCRQLNSLAYDLQQMRAHIFGLKSIPFFKRPLYSAVFFGPPGTGKTTLLEALAVSSGVPLVEVTPSDIVVAGEAFVERRARDVFRALSCLSTTVVLFDEFDPVLRSRKLDEGHPPTVFSFLTPGMLPKLKDLNRVAELDQVSFGLITNHIGTLDDAAIRFGRFDRKVGVFTPNPTSRSARLFLAILKHRRRFGEYGMLSDKQIDRFTEVIAKTASGSIGQLCKPGHFGFTKEGATMLDLHPRSCLRFVLDDTCELGNFEPPSIDMTPNYVPKGYKGPEKQNAAIELQGWARIRCWDWVLWQYYMQWALAHGYNVGGKEQSPYFATLTDGLQDLRLTMSGTHENCLQWIRSLNKKKKGPRQMARELGVEDYLKAVRDESPQASEPKADGASSGLQTGGAG